MTSIGPWSTYSERLTKPIHSRCISMCFYLLTVCDAIRGTSELGTNNGCLYPRLVARNKPREFTCYSSRCFDLLVNRNFKILRFTPSAFSDTHLSSTLI